MKKQIESIKEWILKRSKRQKIVLILLGFFFIYYVFHLFLTGPVFARQEVLQRKISELKSQENAMKEQIALIQKMVDSPEFKNLITQNKQLQLQGKNIKKTIASFTPVFVAENDFSKLTKDILSQIDKNIVLVSLKEFSDQNWEAPEVD
jgi:predicted PurR-regulated permease PerM